MQVKIDNVNIEAVVKGRSRYSVATVEYDFKGESRAQKVMSFANPTVFKFLQDNESTLPGQIVEVTLTKNAQNYTEWSAIAFTGAEAPVGTAKPQGVPAAGRVTGSNYETAEERAKKQVYIIKQSSITAAISILTAQQAEITVDAVKETAQELTDWVLDLKV